MVVASCVFYLFDTDGKNRLKIPFIIVQKKRRKNNTLPAGRYRTAGEIPFMLNAFNCRRAKPEMCFNTLIRNGDSAGSGGKTKTDPAEGRERKGEDRWRISENTKT
jgi:hypothetical protein